MAEHFQTIFFIAHQFILINFVDIVLLIIKYIFTDYKNELAAVRLQLSDVEADIENLLQRERQLSRRKHELESIINQKQNDLTTADSKWDSSGMFET